MSLSRTVALVTGGVSGLGAAAAQRLLRDGARVCVVDLGSNLSERFWQSSYGDDDETIKSDHHQTSSSQVSFVEADVTNPNQISHALDEIERRFGEPLNATVNCAGIATARKTLSKKGVHPLDEFAKVLSVNTIGSFNVASLAAERMSRRDPDVAGGLRGCIIHVASIAAMEGQIGQVAYAASKGGIVSMTLPMARDLASLGIRVMTIVSAFLVLSGNRSVLVVGCDCLET
jgi:3-hydroxyacyl-CoA dehydrogenase/3-hydroxy-2-methylbutyryl-CoA dehydrogenase